MSLRNVVLRRAFGWYPNGFALAQICDSQQDTENYCKIWTGLEKGEQSGLRYVDSGHRNSLG